MPSKVPFQVVYSSSADDNHREKELEVHVQWLQYVAIYMHLVIYGFILVHTSPGGMPRSQVVNWTFVKFELAIHVPQPVKYEELHVHV